jgi:hypothetical protein
MNVILKFFSVIIFFLIITPAGWIMRAVGATLLTKKPSADATTYWEDHTGKN